MGTNELFNFVINNKISLIISINCKFQNFQQFAISNYKETVLDNKNIKELNKNHTSFRVQVINISLKFSNLSREKAERYL